MHQNIAQGAKDACRTAALYLLPSPPGQTANSHPFPYTHTHELLPHPPTHQNCTRLACTTCAGTLYDPTDFAQLRVSDDVEVMWHSAPSHVLQQHKQGMRLCSREVGGGGGGGHHTHQPDPALTWHSLGSTVSQSHSLIRLPARLLVQHVFSYISAHHAVPPELRLVLRPFMPDYIPALGGTDTFIKVPRPDGQPDWLGLKVKPRTRTRTCMHAAAL
jgi:Intraflagellar transport complex B protein 46 C terminal